MQGYLSIDFLDVGQGDSTFIVTPKDYTVLVDMGSKKNADVAGADAITYVKDKLLAIQQEYEYPKPILWYLFFTHGDVDHYNLFPALLDAFPSENKLVVLSTIIGGLQSEYDTGPIKNFLDAQRDKQLLAELPNCYHDAQAVPSFAIGGGPFGDVRIWMLSANVPNKNASGSGAKNQKSVCLRIGYAGRSVVMMGDAEDLVEDKLIEWYTADFLKCDALKIGHHGSQAGTTVPFLNATRPWSIFASSDQKWAHPYCQTMERIQATGYVATDSARHPWLCGKGAGASKQYFNHSNTEAFFTTLAFQKFNDDAMAEDEKQVMEEILEEFDPDGVLPDGLVQGAQYSFQVAPNGNIRILSTLEGEPTTTVIPAGGTPVTDDPL